MNIRGYLGGGETLEGNKGIKGVQFLLGAIKMF